MAGTDFSPQGGMFLLRSAFSVVLVHVPPSLITRVLWREIKLEV